VDGVKSALIINGQGGTDNLTLEDQSDATGDRATIAGSTVGAAKGDTFFSAPGFLVYFGMSTLRIDGGFGGNLFNVLQTAPGTVTSINSGQGNDTVQVGGGIQTLGDTSGGVVDGIRSPLIVNGQDGTNYLTVNDFNGSGSKQVTVTGFQVGAASGDNFSVLPTAASRIWPSDLDTQRRHRRQFHPD